MPYSAVTQPRPWPLSHGGSRSSRVAVTSTWVSPNFTKQEPSAYFTTPRSSVTARNSSGNRRLGRIASPRLGAGAGLLWRRLLGVGPNADKGQSAVCSRKAYLSEAARRNKLRLNSAAQTDNFAIRSRVEL